MVPRMTALAALPLFQTAASSASMVPEGLRSGVCTVGETVFVPPVGSVVDVVVEVVEVEVVVDDVVVEEVVDEVVEEVELVDEVVVDDVDDDVDEDELLDDVVVPPPPAAGNNPTPFSGVPPLVEKSPT